MTTPVREVRKAVVLAAGLGTRLLPATKAQPKEMLPLLEKPIIQYAVEEAAASGLHQIIMVTAMAKRAVKDHFDRSIELEQALREKGDTDHLAEVQRISELADIIYVHQEEPRGVGHAVLAARDAVGNEPFVLSFPDDVIITDVPVARQLMDVFGRYGGSVLAVERVPPAQLESYGVVDGEPVAQGVIRLHNLVEKPSPQEAPSDLGIVGRYVLTPEIFDALAETPPGWGGEIQLTDALRLLLARQPVFAYQFQGNRYDTGQTLGLLKASVELALRRPDIGPPFRQYLRDLALGGE
jgi:UTP--glucose-1-phosphate uridylyltransferase